MANRQGGPQAYPARLAGALLFVALLVSACHKAPPASAITSATPAPPALPETPAAPPAGTAPSGPDLLRTQRDALNKSKALAGQLDQQANERGKAIDDATK